MKKRKILSLVREEIKQVREDFEYQAEKPLRQNKVDNQPQIKEANTHEMWGLDFVIRFVPGKESYFNFLPTADSLDAVNERKKGIIGNIEMHIERKFNIKAKYDSGISAAGLNFVVSPYDLSDYMVNQLVRTK